MKPFKTESAQLLELVINSIYTDHEVFLRELISNASDALDKSRLARAEAGLPEEDGTIEVSFDADARILTVSDNGIGMDAAALEECLGTIAHSGTRRLREALATGPDAAAIIGQFGIGFYSAFMVADAVTVTSRALGAEGAFRWESDGASGYAISEAVRDKPGTDVALHIRESTADENLERYLDQSSLAALIRRHSNYIRYPIVMDLTEEHFDEATGALISDASRRTRTRINAEAPLWNRPAEEVGKSELADFYQAEFRDEAEPLLCIPLHSTAPLPFDALLFVPASPVEGLWDKNYKRGLRLYSAGVLIEEACETLLPDHLRFVRGVIDTAELNLTASREAIREDGRLTIIARKIERCVTDRLRTMQREDREGYERFFAAYGTGLKFAICASHGDAAPLVSDLLLYPSARHKRLVTLEEYGREAEATGSEEVLYAAGSDLERLRTSPAVQAALRAGLDVLLCPRGASDELCLMLMGTWHGLPFHSVTSANFVLGGESATEKNVAGKSAALCERLLYHAPEPLARITVSPLLTAPEDAASRLSTEGAVTLSMARYAISRARATGSARPALPLVLEVNATHPLVERARRAAEADDGAALTDVACVLLGEALLAEDIPPTDPVAFNRAVNRLIADGAS